MRRTLAAGLLGLAALGAATSCAEQRVAGPPPSHSATPAASSPGSAALSGAGAGAAAAAAPPAPAPPAAEPRPEAPAWVDAARLGRWSEAATGIDALGEAERARPEVRYARARVALRLGDFGRAVSLLHHLEVDLPLIATDIERYRAEAALEAGPFAEAAAWFARSRDARDLGRAAEAYAKAGDSAKAIATAARAVITAQRSRRTQDEAAARLSRARVLQQIAANAQRPRFPAAAPAATATASAATATTPAATATTPAAAPARAPQPPLSPVVLGDLRWIARNAAGTPEGREAAAALADRGVLLSPVERLDVVEGLIAAGSAAEAAAELEKLAQTGVLPRPELLHRRATALYKARDYPAAAKTFVEAAAIPTARQPEQLYYAARALARSARDADAIDRFREVAAKFPRTSFAESASLEPPTAAAPARR